MDIHEMKIAVILPAAGQSTRFKVAGSGGTEQSKLSAEIGRKAALLRAVELFANRPQVAQIIVAADPDQLDNFKFRWADTLGLLGVMIVPGGRAERWETVMNALAAVEDGVTHVAVHDAARPVADPAMIDRIFEAAKYHDAVVPGLPINSTIKRVEPTASKSADTDPLDAILGGAGKKIVEARKIAETVPRDELWAVQTPQLFKLELLRRAYEPLANGRGDSTAITDDAGLVEALGEPVVIVQGDSMNVKITVPEDVDFANAVYAMRSGRTPADLLGPKRNHPTWAQMSDDD